MGRTYKQDLDRASIEELAATLESKIVSDVEHVDDETVALAERRAPESPHEAGAASLPPILVAHVDPGVRASVRAALEHHFKVLETEDGEEAWDMLSAYRDVRVLLIGTRLPRLDGIELIRRLRRPNGPEHLVGLPIMVYAGDEDPAAKQTVLLAGANDYLLDDTEPEALLARVQARNRLFEQSRRAMNLTGTKPTARHRRTEPGSGAELSPRVGRGEARIRGPSDRPIWVEARGGKGAVGDGPGGWVQRLYRISSTTTITLTATVLVILGITLILLFNQTPQRPQSLSVGRLETVPRPAEPAPPQADARVEQEPRVTEEPATPPPRADASRDHAAAPRPEPKTEAPSRSPSAAITNSGRSVEPSAPATAAPPERNEAAIARREAGTESRSQTPRPPAEAATPPRSVESSPPPRVAAAPTREEPPKPALREPQSTVKTGEPKPAPREPEPTPPAPSTTQTARAEQEQVPRPANVDQTTVPSPAAPAGVAAPTDAVAAAPPVAATPPPRPAPVRLSREELASLLQRFVSVYEAGDIEQFMALLADNVQTNDRITRQAVRDDYARLFRTTDLRQMRIETMNWDVEDDQAHGWGEFEVRVRRQGDATVHHYQGSITVQVRKAGGRPRIERLYHSERRASR